MLSDKIDFPGGSDGKAYAYNEGDPGSICDMISKSHLSLYVRINYNIFSWLIPIYLCSQVDSAINQHGQKSHNQSHTFLGINTLKIK